MALVTPPPTPSDPTTRVPLPPSPIHHDPVSHSREHTQLASLAATEQAHGEEGYERVNDVTARQVGMQLLCDLVVKETDGR